MREGRAHPRLRFFLRLSFVFSFLGTNSRVRAPDCSFLLSFLWGIGERYYDRLGRSGAGYGYM